MTDSYSQTLRYVKPSLLRPEWLLLAGYVKVATLGWENWKAAATFGPALAESTEGKWKFIPNTKKGHFLHRQFKYRQSSDPIVVRKSESDAQVASITMSGVGNGQVEFSDGRTFQWSRTRRLWHPLRDYEWELTNSEGARLVKVNRSMANDSTGTLEVEEGGESMPDHGLITLLGLFLIVWSYSGYGH